ncbi:MAG: HD domain-containing protein [Candidatus Aenigmatarchaeota archaeon]|nr:MAG: HD domain-containing protein [Candidatus Aenigmarchaeota archaeon]
MPPKPVVKSSALVQKAENFMLDSFSDFRSKIPRVIGEGMVRHNLQCREHVKELVEKGMDAEALEVAALLHNIGRAYIKNNRYPQFDKLALADKSAEIAADFLRKQKVKPDVINRVKKFIKLHEKGGTKEVQILVEADGIAFLENTLPIWFEVGLWMGQSKEMLIDTSREKVEAEYKQIKSKKGREIAKRFYDKWTRWLEQKEEVVKQEQY